VKLILFIHGLGGSKKTWGDFPTLINLDSKIDKKIFDIAIYEYPTSLIRPRSILNYFGYLGKIVSFFFPQKKLPTISQIAKGLREEINNRYNFYDEIYLITHSMGGLVAKKYLYDEIEIYKNQDLKIKKLLLYAVPNLGSNWAELAKLYNHEQILQLSKSSDFLDFFNTQLSKTKLNNYLKIKYVIGTDDKIVDIQSAQESFGNLDTTRIFNGHLDIVKPKSLDDLNYIIFKNFILDNDNFIEYVLKKLYSSGLVVLFSQNYSRVLPTLKIINSKIKKRFDKDFHHFFVPKTDKKGKYFAKLGLVFGAEFKSSNDFKKMVMAILKDNDKKLFLYVSEFENGNIKFNREFSLTLRFLKDNYSNFYSIIIGREKLADMVYNNQSHLSPLKNAKKIFFPNNAELDFMDIKTILDKLLEDREEICEYLNENFGYFDIYDEPKATLFWNNLLLKNGDKLLIKDKRIKKIVNEILKCL